MAVISLSAASRLRPSRMPTSTAMGMVTVNMLGRVRRNDLDDCAQRGAVADHQLQEVRQVAHEEDEGEERAADEGVREHFVQDVSRQDAHRFEPALSLSRWFLCGVKRFRRRLLARTLTELRAIAAAATAGLRRSPVKG